MTAPPSRIPHAKGTAGGLRADARHNRERILAAARDTFAAHGLDVPMAEIARRAGVGVATLYRRFPTKEALVTEAFAEQFATCVSVVDDALADPDPWRGFRTVIERVCVMQAADRGFTAAFLTAFPDAVPVDGERARAEQGLAELVRRAKDAGRLRADFVMDDLTLLLMANNGVTAGSPEAAEAACRRFVAYFLQAFGAGPAERTGPLPPAPSLELRRLFRPDA